MSSVTGSGAAFQIRSEPRGPHWIGWVVRAGSEKPDRGIVLVGRTQEEAEARAREWTRSIYALGGSDLSARSR